MRLFGYWRSSSTWRVRIGLGLKGLPYETVAVNLLNAEHTTDDYRKRSPMAQLPAFEDGDVVLTQSLAILEYLDERHPEPPLLPGDAVQRARIRMMAEVVNSGIQPLQNMSVLRRIEAMGTDKGDWSREWIDTGLAVIESMATGPGPFLVADSPTLAECCVIPQLYNARRFGLDVSRYPRLAACETACRALPAFADSHPDRQVDAVT